MLTMLALILRPPGIGARTHRDLPEIDHVVTFSGAAGDVVRPARGAADRIGISKQAMYRRLAEGKPAYRLVKTHLGILIDPESIDEHDQRRRKGELARATG